MRIVITQADGTERTFECPASPAAPVAPFMQGREWKRVTVTGTAEEALEAFTDGITWRQEWDSAVIGEDGTETTEVQVRDLSDFCVAGDVVDHRDGTVSVYMGRRTKTEILQDQVDVLGVLLGEEA